MADSTSTITNLINLINLISIIIIINNNNINIINNNSDSNNNKRHGQDNIGETQQSKRAKLEVSVSGPEFSCAKLLLEKFCRSFRRDRVLERFPIQQALFLLRCHPQLTSYGFRSNDASLEPRSIISFFIEARASVDTIKEVYDIAVPQSLWFSSAPLSEVFRFGFQTERVFNLLLVCFTDSLSQRDIYGQTPLEVILNDFAATYPNQDNKFEMLRLILRFFPEAPFLEVDPEDPDGTTIALLALKGHYGTDTRTFLLENLPPESHFADFCVEGGQEEAVYSGSDLDIDLESAMALSPLFRNETNLKLYPNSWTLDGFLQVLSDLTHSGNLTALYLGLPADLFVTNCQEVSHALEEMIRRNSLLNKIIFLGTLERSAHDSHDDDALFLALCSIFSSLEQDTSVQNRTYDLVFQDFSLGESNTLPTVLSSWPTSELRCDYFVLQEKCQPGNIRLSPGLKCFSFQEDDSADGTSTCYESIIQDVVDDLEKRNSTALVCFEPDTTHEGTSLPKGTRIKQIHDRIHYMTDLNSCGRGEILSQNIPRQQLVNRLCSLNDFASAKREGDGYTASLFYGLLSLCPALWAKD